jgi:hypothetical protein
MLEDAPSVEAGIVAAESVADLDVHRCASSRTIPLGRPAGNALDRDFGAITTVDRRIDGRRSGDLGAATGGVGPIGVRMTGAAFQEFEALVFERDKIPRAFADAGADVLVRQSEEGVPLGERDSWLDLRFGGNAR